MDKTNGFCMQRLSFANIKTVVYELFVLIKDCPFKYFISSICFVIEQWMSDIFHMHTDLVSATGFQYASYQGYISQTLKHFKMCDGFFTMFPVRISLK